MEGAHPLFVLTGTRCSSLSVYIVKSMKPAAAVVSLGRNISPNEDVVASGVIPDRAFKPLQGMRIRCGCCSDHHMDIDARKWRKSRVPRLEHGLETVLSRYVIPPIGVEVYTDRLSHTDKASIG